MRMNLIVARSNNYAIGFNNNLLWYLPNDLKRFKELTNNNIVIQGRKTYESIGKPLPNRINIVVTRNESYDIKGCNVYNSLIDAIDIVKNIEYNDTISEIFIIGGSNIYRQVLKLGIVDRIYLTEVDVDIKEEHIDSYFDYNIDDTEWKLVESIYNYKDEKHFTNYTYKTYDNTRIK